MITQAQFLSPEEQQIIHNESIRILEEVGALFYSKKALGILEKNGAKVDRESNIAKIPAEMVNQALKTAPRSFICGARVPDNDFALPSTFSGYVLDNGGIFTRDFKTGERRIANEQDHYELLRVFDEMKLATMVWGTSVQTPEPYNTIRTTLTSYMHSSLHIQDELGHPAEVPFIIEGLEAILGSSKAVRQRKLFSVIYCTLAPLVHEGHLCDAYLDLIEYEQPICIFPMTCAGSTGPARDRKSVV